MEYGVEKYDKNTAPVALKYSSIYVRGRVQREKHMRGTVARVPCPFSWWYGTVKAVKVYSCI